MTSITKRPAFWLTLSLLLSFFPTGCLFSGHKKTAAKTQNTSVAPDKMLYDRALDDYKHGRYTEARLSLQALINSYPDSEYLAKAKLAVADSYYKQGGVDGLTQAVAEYKDFITFFPFLDEAAYAQMQVAMAHYRMMEKPDRDPTQAQLAEEEFQTFLLKYPKSPLVPEADQRLREVQEVLGEGDYDVAHFYYVKGDYRAAAARLIEVTNRYPLFSEGDRALWMLGDIYQRAAKGSKNEQQRALWRTQSDNEYARLVREYPLSPLATDAKRRLSADGMKIPPPDPAALARAEYDEKFAREHHSLVRRAEDMIKTSPDVSEAARMGQPDLNPPGEIESPQNVFQGVSNSNVASDTGGSGASGQSVGVETVSPGDSSASPEAAGAPTPPTDPTTTPIPSASAPPPADAVPPPSSATPPPTDTTTAMDQQAAKTGTPKPASKKLNKRKESSSKRKRGLKKLIPW